MAEFNSSSYSEVDANNTSASPNGWANGTFFNQVEPIGRATLGGLKRFWDRINGTVLTTGISGTYTYTPANISYPVAYVQGEQFSFKADKASTGSDGININNLGILNLYKTSTSSIAQIAANDIITGAHITGQIDTALNSGAGGFLITSGLTTLANFGAITATSIQFNTAAGIIGTATNDNAAGGSVGEDISSTLTSSSAVGLTTNLPHNITSIALTAGDWDVWGGVAFTTTSSTIVTAYIGGISLSSAALPALPTDAASLQYFPAGVTNLNTYFPVGSTRISTSSSSLNVFLVAQSSFTSSVGAYGIISGRRRR